jgi:hypothetical protein
MVLVWHKARAIYGRVIFFSGRVNGIVTMYYSYSDEGTIMSNEDEDGDGDIWRWRWRWRWR